jgi:hypothetical protein
MVVKIKCKCGTSKVLRVSTLKVARKLKRVNKGWMCNACAFKIIAERAAKEIVGRAKRYA